MERAGTADRRRLRRQPGAPDPLSAALRRAFLDRDRGDDGRGTGAGSPPGAASPARAPASGLVVGRAVRCTRQRGCTALPPAPSHGVMGQSAWQLHVRAGPSAVPRSRGGAGTGTTRPRGTALGLVRLARSRRGACHAERYRRLFRAAPADRDAGAAGLLRRVAEPEFPGISAAGDLAPGDHRPRLYDRRQTVAAAPAAATGAVPHGARSYSPRRAAWPGRAARGGRLARPAHRLPDWVGPAAEI